MLKDKQSCHNCKYFFQHYGWSCNKFSKINCGHCLKRNIATRDYKRFPFYCGCEQWESKEKEIAIRKENVANILTGMANHINEILILLENGYLKP